MAVPRPPQMGCVGLFRAIELRAVGGTTLRTGLLTGLARPLLGAAGRVSADPQRPALSSALQPFVYFPT